ncbi:MAG: lipid A biosynthesis acyltransferase [Betaproteobacteria bacterium]|nr:lipid A biosynthesis acyltransferase [Betaproteobacteria bacterium]NBT75375.1 lipid A biosynthesis acyltransferase [Betaproteobacteria bacterium]NCA15936.1 lipid A biosynthesis acyltransferase [Betaproteobacteria bacterium]
MRVLQELVIALGLGAAWLVSRLPRSLRHTMATALGGMLYRASSSRRAVALTNLRLCFPEWSDGKVQAVARQHFVDYAHAFFDRFVIWSSSEAQIREWVTLHGLEHWSALKGRPIIVLAPHFLGLDAGGIRLQLECRMVSMYSVQSSAFLNRWVLRGRSRFNDPTLLSRQDGIGRLLRLMKQDHVAYFLPDMDFGERDSVFAQFFGQPAATVTSVVRIAQITGASVIPLVTRMTDGGYEARFYPAWTHQPGEDLQAAVQAMNHFIEARVLEMPSQYLWTHRRFKTRPRGAAPVYG